MALLDRLNPGNKTEDAQIKSSVTSRRKKRPRHGIGTAFKGTIKAKPSKGAMAGDGRLERPAPKRKRRRPGSGFAGSGGGDY